MAELHPAFVHFPIALLLIYTILILFPISRLAPRVAWDQILEFLLYAGTVSLAPTVLSGLMIGGLAGGPPVLALHRTVGLIVAGIFVMASLFSLLRHMRPGQTHEISLFLERCLAALGFLGLFVQGALGGAMVYGFTADPVISFVTALLNLR